MTLEWLRRARSRLTTVAQILVHHHRAITGVGPPGSGHRGRDRRWWFWRWRAEADDEVRRLRAAGVIGYRKPQEWSDESPASGRWHQFRTPVGRHRGRAKASHTYLRASLSIRRRTVGGISATDSAGSTTSLTVRGRCGAQRRVLPLVEVRAEFSISRVELDDADRGAIDLDLPELDEAVQQIAIGENVAVFHGYGPRDRGHHEAPRMRPSGTRRTCRNIPLQWRRRWTPCGSPASTVPTGWPFARGLHDDRRIHRTRRHLLFDHLHRILGGPLVWAPV